MDRYQRNKILSSDEQLLLLEKRVCIMGCGGLGGYVIEMLTRLGIGNITVVDGDVFEVTNLNRQILSLNQNLGKSKAFTAGERIEAIDGNINVNVVAAFVTRENVKDVIRNHDVVVDALDSNATRGIVLEACKVLGIPFVHGAIGGWYGQVSTIFPEDSILRQQITEAKPHGIENDLGNPSFTPACIASVQVAQTLKLLLGRGELLRNKLMYFDLFTDEVQILNFNNKESK